MKIFAVLLFLAAAIGALATLAMGLVNLAKSRPDEADGPQPSARAVKSNKLMRQRILFQAIALAALALMFLLFAPKG